MFPKLWSGEFSMTRVKIQADRKEQRHGWMKMLCLCLRGELRCRKWSVKQRPQ